MGLLINTKKMNSENKPTAKDFFLNLGAIVALAVFVGNFISLLFTVINRAYPPTDGGYYVSSSISFPVAALIIIFPVYLLLMWLLERDYSVFSELRHGIVRRWLTFITLFVAGGALIGDLITVLYYFIDGRDMTAGFLMKVLSVLIISLGVFFYYIYDLLGKTNSSSRKIWVGVSALVILLSIVWGFSVLGSPKTQRLMKYDEQKVNDLMAIDGGVNNYYSTNGALPQKIEDFSSTYYVSTIDSQTGEQYVYEKTGDLNYKLCAMFNMASQDLNNTYSYPKISGLWVHLAGEYCFERTVNPNSYYKGIPDVPFR